MSRLLSVYDFAFGDEPCDKDRIHERRRIMQCLIFLLQMHGDFPYCYDDFKLKVTGVHSLKLSKELDKVIPYETQR